MLIHKFIAFSVIHKTKRRHTAKEVVIGVIRVQKSPFSG
nr:MAG TPA: hypothetical protein [Caudoviricetes sp.]